MKKLLVPDNEVDLAFVKGLLESNGVRYFVHNDHFGSMRVGPQIELLNQKTVMVDERDEARAIELLDTYLTPVEAEAGESGYTYTFWQKFRILAEALLFGWFMPGSGRGKNK